MDPSFAQGSIDRTRTNDEFSLRPTHNFVINNMLIHIMFIQSDPSLAET